MLNNQIILKAFGELDKILPEAMSLLIGGGGAILLLKIFPVSTLDVDAIPYQSVIGSEELKPYREAVAKKLDLPADWINEYFYQFTHCLPEDYPSRLKTVFRGKRLHCRVLSPTDIAIMKLFAGRAKDQSHLRHLFKKSLVDLRFIEKHISQMEESHHPGAQEAYALLEELVDSLGISL